MSEHQAFPYQPIDESPAWRLIEGEGLRRRPAPQASFARSMGFAIEGVVFAFRTQRNFRIHCLLGIFAMTLGCLLRLPFQQLVLVAVLTLLVLCAELMNTAIESTLDLHAGEEHDPAVKHIKDIAAGSVLVVSLGAAALGGSIFLPALARHFCR